MKKIYLSVVVFISLILMGMSLNVFAAPSVVISGNIVSISGTVNVSEAGKVVTAHVTKSAEAIDKINSSLAQGTMEIEGISLNSYIRSNVLYVNQVEAAANGSYELYIYMNPLTPEGNYILTLSGEALNKEVVIVPIEYKGTARFIESIRLLNQAYAISEVDLIIRDYADYYGFDLTEYNKNALVKDAVATILLNNTYSENISLFSGTVVKLKKDYDDTLLLAVLNHEPSANDLLSYISRNLSVLGLSNDIFEDLSNEAKAEVGENLVNADYSDISDFKVKFAKLKLLSLINYSESWGNLAGLTEENVGMLELSIGDISQYDEKRSGAYKNVYAITVNEGFDSLSDYISTLRSVFDSYELPKQNTSADAGRPSKSSGGAGSGISVPKEAVQVIVNPPILNNVTESENNALFADTKGHWAQSAIETLAQKEIINGKDSKTFAPDDAITRAEFAAVLFRALKPEKKDSQLSFSDVNKDSDWFAVAVNTLADLGVVSGSNGEFRPNENISREEMAKMIVLAYESSKSVSVEANANAFLDENSVSDWAKDYVNKCVSLGIINGIPSDNGKVFSPRKNATRGETAKVILEFCNSLGK